MHCTKRVLRKKFRRTRIRKENADVSYCAWHATVQTVRRSKFRWVAAIALRRAGFFFIQEETTMIDKKMSLALAAALVAVSAGAANAEPVGILGAIPAAPMSEEQMKAVEGKAHVYLLVESRGVELPAQGEAATRAAAPTPQNGGNGNSPTFARSPSRDAAAFNFLPPPPTPTRG